MNKRFFLSLFLFLLIPISIQTQTSRLGWDQEAISLADAQAYTYKYYADGTVTGIVFTGVTCAGTISPFQCSAPLPTFTPGNHRITLSASNITGESAKSGPLDFTFPNAPSNLRIISGS